SASEIAARAGVTLGAVYVLGNPHPEEANAFATGGKVIAVTRGLVECLSRRELRAVIAHEIGHLRGKHVGVRSTAFWAYILVPQPIMWNALPKLHAPGWILSLPLLPVAYVFATALLSRRHEYSADARAAELTDDPEGMIAALARLRMLTRTPVHWGGIQG